MCAAMKSRIRLLNSALLALWLISTRRSPYLRSGDRVARLDRSPAPALRSRAGASPSLAVGKPRALCIVLQYVAGDLARHGFRQVGHDAYLRRALVCGEPLAAKARHLADVEFGARLGRNEGDDSLASIGVRAAHHRGFAHAGKGVEHVLHLPRPHLEAGG